MPLGITRVFGIDNKVKEELSRHSITTLKRLSEATRTPISRRKLAEKSGLPEDYIYYWAKQADLLRVTGMSPENAVDLIHGGIRNVEDLKAMPAEAVFKKIRRSNPDSLITAKMIEDWQKAKVRPLPIELEPDLSEAANPVMGNVMPEVAGGGPGGRAPGGFGRDYNDLANVIGEIGRGIADAQRQLDLQAIEIQNEIFADERLTNYGLNATWYTIPEAEFTLKMEYTMAEERSESGQRTPRIRIIPSNATYNNLFKTNYAEESTFRIRFVPVPLDDRMSDRRIMPSLVGLSEQEGERRLNLAGIDIKEVFRVAEPAETGHLIARIIDQFPAPNTVLQIGQSAELTVQWFDETADSEGGASHE